MGCEQRTQRNLFFIKSGDTDFMKDPAACGGLRVREAMSGFPLAASPAKGKIVILCVLCVLCAFAVNNLLSVGNTESKTKQGEA